MPEREFYSSPNVTVTASRLDIGAASYPIFSIHSYKVVYTDSRHWWARIVKWAGLIIFGMMALGFIYDPEIPFLGSLIIGGGGMAGTMVLVKTVGTYKIYHLCIHDDYVLSSSDPLFISGVKGGLDEAFANRR